MENCLTHRPMGAIALISPMRLLMMTLIAWLPAGFLAAAVTEEQRNQLERLNTQIQTAGTLYADGKFVESAETISAVQRELLELLKTKDAALHRLAKPLFARLGRAHGLLELEGAELAPLPAWETLLAAEDERPASAAGMISFKADVAPWLVTACGNCHINNRRGKFSMASFENLMQGVSGAAVLFPGSSRGSRLVEVIESGDMPRGGGKVSAEQLTALKNWIDQGAKFDGPDPTAAMPSYAFSDSTGSTADPSSLELKTATGQETVSFAKDIAPILKKNCQGCHIAGRQASGNLRMDTFAQLLRGGDSGVILSPARVEESLLIKKLKGQSGQRMPAGGRPPLADEQIELISTWIREGAAFDGPSPDTNIETVVNQAWAASADHTELFERRQQRALERWTRVQPNENPATAKNEEIFVVGNVPPARIESVLLDLDKAIAQTKKLLRLKQTGPLLKGGITVFVLKNRYDYSEFGRMTENRELPKEWLGHWHADPVDAYCVLAADGEMDSEQTAAVALQVICGAYLGSFADVPTWFAEGVARSLVRTSFRRDDPRVLAWQRALPNALLKVDDSKALLEGRLDQETAGLVGMNLAVLMMDRANRRRFDSLLELLRDGQTFTQACTAAYAPPEILVKGWLGK